MTYANAVLPHALFVAAHCWPEEDFLEVAETSFAFLDRETTVEDVFWPVGNSDWYPRGEEKSPYDQQPVEAVTMADAALAGFALLGDARAKNTWLRFRRAQAWFHGQNSLRQPLVDVRCGACCDGLQPSGVNRNQGAESTLAYLWAELHNKDNSSCVENRNAPQQYAELFHRHGDNPILTARDWPYPAHTVFNAGACQLGKETVLLVRVEDRRGHSHLTVARSKRRRVELADRRQAQFRRRSGKPLGRRVGRGRRPR